MPVTIEGVVDTESLIANIDTKTKRRVVRKLIDEAHKIADLAKKMAPRDHANLEEAIKVRPDSPERTRDELGRFVRTEVEVYVDGDMPVPQRPDKTVGDYAYEMHEHLTPFGPLQLGEESRAKQASNGGVEVGGGYLTRAVEELGADIVMRLASDMRNDLG